MRGNVPVNVCPNTHTFQDKGDVFTFLYISITLQSAIREIWYLRVPEDQLSYPIQVQSAVDLSLMIYQYS
jgi:hypothetical protein